MRIKACHSTVDIPAGRPIVGVVEVDHTDHPPFHPLTKLERKLNTGRERIREKKTNGMKQCPAARWLDSNCR
jgi:hypothetical protein